MSVRKGLSALACVGVVFFAGCAQKAPFYQPSIDNIELLKAQAAPTSLGSFTVKSTAVGATSIGLRASSMTSPVGDDYAAYLADALRQELTIAGKLDPKAGTEISGELLKNDIAAGGLSTNSGEIDARFMVKRGAETRYDKVKRSELSWESSFLGSVAIPRARDQYVALVQKLIAELLADKEFMSALK